MFDLASLMSDASNRAAERQKYEVVRLPIEKLYPDPANRKIYSIESIDELADAIEMAGGVMHNLVVREPDLDGRYQIISGERRWEACRRLAEQGKEKYAEVGCLIEHVHDEDTLRLMLVLANSTARQLTDAEKMRQAESLMDVLQKMRDEGKVQGRIRDIACKMLKTTSGQLARYHAIEHNLQGGLRERFETGKIGVSVAYEASKLTPAAQDEAEKEAVKAPITLNSISEIKKKSEERQSAPKKKKAAQGAAEEEPEKRTEAWEKTRNNTREKAYLQLLNELDELEKKHRTDDVTDQIICKLLDEIIDNTALKMETGD